MTPLVKVALSVVAATLVIVGPQSIALAATRLFVTNNLTDNAPGGRLVELNGATGEFIRLVDEVRTPRGIASGPDRNLYFTSANNNLVLKYSLDEGLLPTTFAADDHLSFPWAITFGPDEYLYVATAIPGTDLAPDPVVRFDISNGDFIDSFIPEPDDDFLAFDMKFGPDGNLYLATSQGVLRYDGETGASMGVFVPNTFFTLATGITWDASGNLYVASETQNAVLRYDGDNGLLIDVFVSANSGGLTKPYGIDFGPDGNFYVASAFTDEILRYDRQTGEFMDVFATNGLDGPFYFAFVVPEPACSGLLALCSCGLLMFSTRRR